MPAPVRAPAAGLRGAALADGEGGAESITCYIAPQGGAPSRAFEPLHSALMPGQKRRPRRKPKPRLPIGPTFKAERERRGWTQAKCAEHLGVARLSVIRWESGAAKGPIGKLVLAAVARFLDGQ